MADQAYPTINGVEPSWADVKFEFQLVGGPQINTDDIAGFKFSDKVTVGVKKGTSGGRIMSRTVGEIESDASIIFYMGGWRKLLRGLGPLAPQKRISLVTFNVPIKFSPPGELDIYKYLLPGCRVIGRSFDLAEGSDAQKVEIPISLGASIEEDDGFVLL